MNIRLSNLILISSLLILSSCLKDKDVDEGRIGIRPDGSTRLVEISGPISGLRTVAFASSAVLPMIKVWQRQSMAVATPKNNISKYKLWVLLLS